MESNDSRPLCEQFPMLAFSKAADDWLQSIQDKSILEQLQERRITQMGLLRMLSTAGIGYTDDGNFIVHFNDYSNHINDAFSIGHEIGHTFHFDLTKTPPPKIINENSPEFLYDFDEDGANGFLIEDFCDAFAQKWLSINGKEDVEEMCKRERSFLIPYKLNSSQMWDQKQG